VDDASAVGEYIDPAELSALATLLP
jgi:hypothetical protein